VPIYRNRTVLEITRNVQAFLNVDAGITRGEVPNPEHLLKDLEQTRRHVKLLQEQLSSKDQQIEQLRKRLSGKDRRVPALPTRQQPGEPRTRSSNANPKFSIVIPTYNRVSLLNRAVESALRQDGFDDYEVFVVDDDSDDGTWEYLQNVQDSKLRILRNPHRLSMGPNWNKAVRLSRGEYIFVLQDDDLVSPDLLVTVSRAIDEYESADLVCFGANLIDENERIRRIYEQPEQEELLPPPKALMRFARRWTLSSGQVVFSRAAFDRYGGFDESTPIMSDTEAILRWMLYCDTLLIPAAPASRRVWRGQVTNYTHHTPEMSETMRYVADKIFRLASDSGRLDSTQLDKLQLSLQRMFVEPFEKPRSANHYMREVLPRKYNRSS
jgi:Glycosyl transferase family 2